MTAAFMTDDQWIALTRIVDDKNGHRVAYPTESGKPLLVQKLVPPGPILVITADGTVSEA